MTIFETTQKHANTDVYYEYESLVPYVPASGGFFWGSYWCVRGNSDASECDHAHVAFDRNRVIEEGYTQLALVYMTCHETGHTLGLTHPPGTTTLGTHRCLHNGGFPGTTSTFWGTVGPHNVAHIVGNSHY